MERPTIDGAKDGGATEERTFVPTGQRKRNSSLRKSGSSLKASTDLYRRKSSGSFVMSTIRTVKIKELAQGMGYIYNKTSEWASKFPEASGENQSPVDILSRDAIFDPGLQQRPLIMSYVMCRETDVCNNGHTVVACLHHKSLDGTFSNEQVPTSSVTGGPFEAGHEYELTEFRFHWGKSENRGSEHTVNSKAFPMELHLIHYNATLYPSFEDAVGQPNGVAVIGLFVQVGKEHAGLKIITDQLEDIQYKGRQKTITSAFNPMCLLPDEMLRDFWTYKGSFTSPPCTEEVTWVIFRYPLTISFNQVEEFRRLRTHHKGELPPPEEDGALVDNFRPTQPINGRKIIASFLQ